MRKKKGDPLLRRRRRGDSMNRRLWAPNKQACQKGAPCRHPNQSTKTAAKEVNAIAAKKMPRTPAVPPVGRKIVQEQPDRSVAKVSVIDLNSGPFVKALWKTKIACQPDSDSGESSTPSDAMPKWPPQRKAMPKNRHRANAVLQWLQ